MVHEPTWISVEIPTANSITMMAAVVDGNPPLPPEHIQHATCVSGIHQFENESKHPNASFISSSKPPGTQPYALSHIEKSNGCADSDHEPLPPQQLRPYFHLEHEQNYHNASFLPPSLITKKTTQQQKTEKTLTVTTSSSVSA